MGKILLLDGHNLAFRAYYALPELSRSDGQPTGALHGWIKTLWKLCDDHQPERVIVFFDLDGSNRHLDLQADYKAHRSEMPEALQRQMSPIKQLTRLCGMPVVEQSGIEADDLIASAAHQFAASEKSVIVVSADKDLAQLVGPQITQLLPAPTANPRLGWRLLDEAGVVERFGVQPGQIPDYLALVGDTSDNIEGIPGVGPKTAAKWIGQYGSLHQLLQSISTIKPARFIPLITDNQAKLLVNLEMTTLDKQVPLLPIEPIGVDGEKVVQFLHEMEMKRSAQEAEERYFSLL